MAKTTIGKIMCVFVSIRVCVCVQSVCVFVCNPCVCLWPIFHRKLRGFGACLEPTIWETPHVCGNRFARFLTVETANAEIRVCVGRVAQKLIPINLNLRVSMVGYVCVLGAKQAMF